MNTDNSLAVLHKKKVYIFSVMMILGASVIISFFISLSFGAYKISIPDIFKAIFIDKEGLSRNIIWKVRVPRTCVAGAVGVCLSLAGAILQGVMRNPLASPNTIGVSAGAGLVATVTLVLIPNYSYLLTPCAFIGAFTITLIIYIVSWKDGVNPLRMILAGIAISSLVNAIINMILIFYPDRVHNTLGFTVGSLSAKTWADFKLILPYAVIGFILSMIMSKKLNILMLGDEIATSLGLKIERVRLILILLSSLLAASAVSVVGMLGFVGLIVPHITRIVIGSDYRYLLPASAMLGAALVTICDTIARVVVEPIELPVGLILSLFGVPFFLYLLRGGLKKRVKSR
ncbi:iron complex transport system permease protein [Hathewaya proteolytica DSM 3090]|uniref:Iron complex transport system permease protein n=1 Tax=Hathewaya proteolytica DSM 3090 TaxID=1121331 RepID=A0A1M6QLI7_9CLOT|nr:iron ABC transporter permease [Hathewaya proteolytica]SHK21149.1 iron complex transport system permease protein [Hathewaya proteolytica DSM 3090]